MHPAREVHRALVHWWHAQHGGCGPWRERPDYSCGHGGGGDERCGPGRGGSEGGGGGEWDDGGGGGGFGVRRPLRFLAYKLGLDDRQVAAMARVLDELKTERAQAEVDRRRTVAAFADAIASDAFEAARANEGGTLRVESATRVKDAVVRALAQIHALLDPEQRAKLAYLIRTGTLSL